MTYRGGPDRRNGDDRRHVFALGLSPAEFGERFARLETMSEVDPSPLVRAVRDNTKAVENLRLENDREHKTIRLQVYFFMATVGGAIGSILLLRAGVLGP